LANHDVRLGDWVRLGNRVRLGDWVTLGDDVMLGNWVRLGNRVRLGNWITLGNRVTLGDDDRLEKISHDETGICWNRSERRTSRKCCRKRTCGLP
jgi:UDP-3-O-[3-hydroxymyristoyl] glucosamine N-acyltransferase